MGHTIEPAASGRAKCRGCGEKIAKGELRLGARLPNPFVEGELTLWFHLECGAYKRPGPYLEAIRDHDGEPPEDAPRLAREAELGLEHHRLTRIDRASPAPTGRATCRHCKTLIEKGAWRIGLVYYEEEEGRFSPSGYLHPRCVGDYTGTRDVMARVRRFSPGLDDEAEAAIVGEVGSAESSGGGEPAPE